MAFQHFNLSIHNHIAHLELNRPEKANALNEQAWEDLRDALLHCHENPEVRVVVLSAAGDKLFSAGIDLSMLMSTGQKTQDPCEGRKREKFRKFLLDLQNTVNAAEQCTKPILSAIHGGCIGGAVDIVTATDMRYCTADAYFCIKEIDMGMVADLGTLQRLPKLISEGLVRELAYTGRNLGATEAERCGLVNRVFPDKATMLDEVMKIAATIASKSPLSIRGTKQNLLYARDHSVAESLQFIANWNAAFFYSSDLMAAFQASMTKQPATFEN
ncbi:MAG: crotonase/enoyl-CoA hydratase family protein [Spirosomataceae bacterium]